MRRHLLEILIPALALAERGRPKSSSTESRPVGSEIVRSPRYAASSRW